MSDLLSPVESSVLYESVYNEGVSDRRANQAIMSRTAFISYIIDNYPVYLTISVSPVEFNELYNVYGKGYRKSVRIS